MSDLEDDISELSSLFSYPSSPELHLKLHSTPYATFRMFTKVKIIKSLNRIGLIPAIEQFGLFEWPELFWVGFGSGLSWFGSGLGRA